MSEDLSAKMRTYLAEIYRLADKSRPGDNNGFVSTSMLAEELDVSAPAVNRMINRLREMGMLDHEPYQGIQLTKAGEEEALRQIRNHRIAESFLVKVMGFKWDEVYDEAYRVSAAVSATVAERMAEMAQRPQFCPHGEPIPAADGSIIEMHDILLADALAGQKAEVSRFRTRERDRLQYITALGLTPGARLEVLHLAPFNGPMQLKVGREYRIIGHNLAELIRVRILDSR